MKSSRANLTTDQANFDLKQAPATPSDLASAEASLQNAKGSLESAQNNYNNNIITAPFEGLIGGLALNKGDQASSGTAIATLITPQKITVIPLNEVDASKVKVGQKVVLIFDAIPDLEITGKVTEIDPLGTVSQGVVNYNVKIAFDIQDDRIKPNMSVNASIIVDVAQDVLVVPNEALKNQGNSSYVQVADATTGTSTESLLTSSGVELPTPPASKTVQTGLSNDTETEITGGLSEGDLIVIRTTGGIAVAKTTTTAQSGLNLLGGGNNRGGGVGGGVRTGGAARGN